MFNKLKAMNFKAQLTYKLSTQYFNYTIEDAKIVAPHSVYQLERAIN